MSIKLKILSIWTPQSLLINELDRVAEVTTECLDKLLKEHSAESLNLLEDLVMEGNLEQRRALMAEGHNVRVNALIDAIGYEKAMEVGRTEMFKAGYKLGLEARGRLGVNENIRDTIKAAQILYRVLGIEFKVEKLEKNMVLMVKRCSLANYYSPETCRMMSAADEGVVHGLNENLNMLFKKRITEGAKECTACIKSKNQL
ncbi:L-2-amino-thiazoline-4-carboxylic acid hydrolase [Methanobacterium aggregans]|uniref:L-2-amino-thiazoline-4-carboxylic acid hydrolase n=1 Tax=Methanobacterium aggregans TaxID=1615586 RepID=UPI001AEA39F4|nr:L-2-amino-thiazoline-4-carboxylic acid hydrolase [Methanobacterium aggregans]MBP2046394.1 hypothetical protein [Methanobacterium aggregans]